MENPPVPVDDHHNFHNNDTHCLLHIPTLHYVKSLKYLGFPNECEDDDNVTLNYVLHAEANAITKLAKSTQSSDGSTLYVTVSPCFECSKLIIQAGVKRLVFKEVYRKPESLKFLFDAGIEIVRIEKTF